MGLRINTNVEAFNAHRNLSGTTSKLAKSMEKLSSGFRINRAADDAAGLGISERMRAQIGGLAQAQRNAQDGISLVQAAEGAMQEMHSILGRVRDLAVQFNNGVLDQEGKDAILAEVTQLEAEITRMTDTARFNNIPLLSPATAGDPMATLQVGWRDNEILVVDSVDVPGSIGTAISSFTALNTATPGVTADLQAIDDAINDLATDRATFGAVQNRLEYTLNSLSIQQENMMAAESRIREVDMAAEMTNFTKLQILQQSGTAMLAQANMAKQSVLSLLSG